MAEPCGGHPVRWHPPGGPSACRALVLPGRAYSPAHPLLDLARQALLQHGWSTRQVWWDVPWAGPAGDPAVDPRAWVLGQVDAAVAEERDAAPAPGRWLVVGKSLGTRAVGTPLDAVGFVLLTPLLDDARLVSDVDAALRRGAQVLLVGGTADAMWSTEVARQLGCDVLEVPGADHALAVPGDVVGTARAQVAVAGALDRFLARLVL